MEEIGALPLQNKNPSFTKKNFKNSLLLKKISA